MSAARRSIYRVASLAVCSSLTTRPSKPSVLGFAQRHPVACFSSLVPLRDTETAASSDHSGEDVGPTIEEHIAVTDDVQGENMSANDSTSSEVSLPFELLKDRVETVSPDVRAPPSLDRRPLVVDWKAARDILVRAQTSTGKIFAYIIPAIESRLNHVERHNTEMGSFPHSDGSARLAYRHRSVGPLILAPTRELAIQIAMGAQKLTTHQRDFEVLLLVGGPKKSRQTRVWMESPRDLVVATPGRLRDLLCNEPEFRQGFDSCPMLILDEADTLLSMGFRDDIDAIVSFLPRYPGRQTLLFSTTLSRAVRQLASRILSPDHTIIDAAHPEPGLTPRRNGEHTPHAKLAVPNDNELTTHNHIEQFHTICPTASDHLPILLNLLLHDQLKHGTNSKVIVFCPTVQMTELTSIVLRSMAKEVLFGNNTEIVTVHTKTRQTARDRTRVLTQRAGKTQSGRPTVLVSSDFYSRCVDYSGVTRIIQVGVPSKENTYTDRIGRMARGVQSIVSKKGRQDNRPTARADLVLLPWEVAYIKWRLTDLPIQSLSISVLDGQLASLAPQPYTLTSESLKSALSEMHIDPADVRNTVASLLGYYLPLTPSLRLQPNEVLAGISSWAFECFGVSIPAIMRLPRRFTDAYEQSIQSEKIKGVFVDGLRIASASPLGKAKSRNCSVWEGTSTRKKKPKRWH